MSRFRGATIAQEFHRLTSFFPGTGYPDHPRRLRSWAGSMREPRPPQFKDYPGVDQIALPTDPSPSGLNVADALTQPPRASDSLDLDELSRLLFYGAGVVRYLRAEDGRAEWFRAAGSSGNLSPLELYAACAPMSGLRAGLYHYAPVEHALHPLVEQDVRAEIAVALADERPSFAYIVLTGVPWRTGWKYGERGLRNVYRDAGTMLAQILPFAGAPAVSPSLRLAFVDAALGATLGLDPATEFPVAVLALGPSAPAAGPARLERPHGTLGDLAFEFPLVTEIQSAGALRSVAEVRAWRAAASLEGDPRPSVPDASVAHVPLEETILRRGSTRRFSAGTAAAPVLTWALPAAARPPAWDVTTRDRTLVEHAVAVHSVEGLPSGLHRLRERGLEIVRSGNLRAEATARCLDQHLAGDGVYAAFHCGSVERVTDALGARGYRALLLEVGYASGRLQLAAHALGYGGSGLTFYDAELGASLGGGLVPQLVTAIGAPAYRPRRGGRPGQPALISRVPAPAIGAPQPSTAPRE